MPGVRRGTASQDAPGSGSAFKQLLAAAGDRSLPPVAQWRPARTGTIDIRIAANGDWYHDGDRIKRFAIAKLFASVLRLDEGAHYLVTPAEKLRIQVDDAPFVATDMEAEGVGAGMRIAFRTNVGDAVVADAAHPIVVADRAGEPRPYVEVRRGLKALIARPVFYRLAALATEEPNGEVAVWSAGMRFRLA